MTMALSAEFLSWIGDTTDGLDTGVESPSTVLPRLAGAGLTAAGVPRAAGGGGGDVVDGVTAIAATAEKSLTAALVLWAQRTYIEYLLQSPNRQIGERLLPGLLSGRLAGATALSNAMKFLAGLEPLQIAARQEGNALVLDGKMPWVTNLRTEGFHVAAAVDRADGGPAFIASLADDDEGLERSVDHSLLGLRSSNTAAVRVSDVRISAERILCDNAAEWLPLVRPAFTGLQCGMSIGLARRSLDETGKNIGTGRNVLAEPLIDTGRRLDRAEARLFDGLRSREFEVDAVTLFQLRIILAEIMAEAVSLELQATGGRAYLAGHGKDFARRWREAAFIPLITPSLTQLKAAIVQNKEAA
jgi:alkylation response protein AidB-like acyl-CoA dehydrogenase